jgi:hypothetical protein
MKRMAGLVTHRPGLFNGFRLRYSVGFAGV